ncbi:MAG: ribonuclease BN [Bacteroidetes bacterium]|nr:MAG: ribonuclease BN [Bacteroidota bacterium]
MAKSEAPKKRITLKSVGTMFKSSFKGFLDDKVPKLASSLSYSTIFSMAPFLILIIALCGLFMGQDAIQGRIYGELEKFLGHNTALQLQDLVKNAAIHGKGVLATVIGVIALLLGATGIFAEIQDSVNMIWGLKPVPKNGLLKLLSNRLLSFSLIISLGFLLLVSLGFSAIVDTLSDKLKDQFSGPTVVVFYILNQIFGFLIVAIIFAVIFRVLPDADIKWRSVLPGTIVSTCLFILGKFGLSFYISTSAVGSTYGAAGALAVFLLWTYFSSLILYFGAEFTKSYALEIGETIHPSEYAVAVKQVPVKKADNVIDKKSVEKERKIADDSLKQKKGPAI